MACWLRSLNLSWYHIDSIRFRRLQSIWGETKCPSNAIIYIYIYSQKSIWIWFDHFIYHLFQANLKNLTKFTTSLIFERKISRVNLCNSHSIQYALHLGTNVFPKRRKQFECILAMTCLAQACCVNFKIKVYLNSIQFKQLYLCPKGLIHSFRTTGWPGQWALAAHNKIIEEINLQ